MFFSHRRALLALMILLASLFLMLPGAAAEAPLTPDHPTPVVIPSASSRHLSLTNLSYPHLAKELRAIVGSADAPTIKVRLTNQEGKPLRGRDIRFRLIHGPAKQETQSTLEHGHILTDEEGFAQSTLFVKDGKGLYLVEASVEDNLRLAEPVTVHIQAYPSAWIWYLVLGLVGGLAMFLYGMDVAGRKLQKLAGDEMRGILASLTRNRVVGMLLGILITFLLQSSSASTVMLVGLVGASLLTLTQAIGVIIGAKIGTTLTVQLIAFNASRYALLIVAVGVGMRLFAKRKMPSRIGSALIGFGLIFIGMAGMSQAMSPLRSSPEFSELLVNLSQYPALAMLVSIVFTAVIQSSSATIGLTMALAAQDLLPLETAIAMSMGASVGTCATALLASLGSRRTGKQVAVAHLLYSLLAAILFLPFLGLMESGSIWLSSLMGDGSIHRQIANAFLLFSVLGAVVFLPLAGQLEWLTRKLVPSREEDEPFKPKYLEDTSIAFPSLALEQALREVQRMMALARQMLVDLQPLVEKPTERGCYALAGRDDQLDTLERAIRPFLAKTANLNGLSEAQASRERAIVYMADALENMGDIISRNLLHALEKMSMKNIVFSRQGQIELRGYLGKVLERFDELIHALQSEDKEAARSILEDADREEWWARKIRSTHLERLHSGFSESVISSEAHLSVVDALVSVNRRITDIARVLVEEWPA